MNALARAIVLALAGAVALPAGAPVPAAAAGSLAVRGQVVIAPIVVELVLLPSSTRPGTWSAAVATVKNVGPRAIAKVMVRLRAPAGVVMRPTTAKVIRRLGGGSSAGVAWSLCARHAGGYLVFAEATLGAVVVASQARLLTVTAGSGTCGGPSRRR